MRSLTVFVGVVALLLLPARRHADLERCELVRTGGLIRLLLRGGLLHDGAPATAADRGAGGGLLGGGFRAACIALIPLLPITFRILGLPRVVLLEAFVDLTAGRLALLRCVALRLPLLALGRRGARGFS